MLSDELLRIIGSLVKDLERQELELLLDHIVALGYHAVFGAAQSWLRAKAPNHTTEDAELVQKDLHETKGNVSEAKADQSDLALRNNADFIHNCWYQPISLWKHVYQIGDYDLAKPLEELLVISSFFFCGTELQSIEIDELFGLSFLEELVDFLLLCPDESLLHQKLQILIL